MTRALESAAGRLAAEWSQRLADVAHGLMENPGRRLAVAEAMFVCLIRFVEETAKAHTVRLEKQAARTKKAEDLVEDALQNCVSGGFSWFGPRPRRQLRLFMDYLAAYARQCLTEDCMAALQVFFGALRSQLGDGLRELSFCRHRLRHVEEILESSLEAPDDNTEAAEAPEMPVVGAPAAPSESYWENIRESATTRVVLPAGEEDLERAAMRFVATLTPEQWLFLDQVFQEQVLALRGGLYQACSSTADLFRNLIVPLLSQATSHLMVHLPVTDVAEVEMGLVPEVSGELAAHICNDYEKAAPLVSAARLAAVGAGSSLEGRSLAVEEERPRDHSFLLVPASEAGKAYADEAKRVLGRVHLVTVPGQADLMFCREQDGLTTRELENILEPCRSAYEESSRSPAVSPHARFDLHDWTPLDP